MKVIIADDHPVVRQGLRQMLAAEADLWQRTVAMMSRLLGEES